MKGLFVQARKKPTLPDGSSVIVEVLDAEQVFGNFGPQLAIKVVVKGGRYAGFEFMDWSKLSRDPKTNEVYVELGTKASEVFEAAFSEDYDPDMEHNPDDLVGKRFMARVGLAGKKQDRNRLEYGTIGPAPDTEAA
jgi:hypothetical protein